MIAITLTMAVVWLAIGVALLAVARLTPDQRWEVWLCCASLAIAIVVAAALLVVRVR